MADISYKNNGNRRPIQPWEFLVVFLLIFFLFSVLLYAIDFVPESPGTDLSQSAGGGAIAAAPAVQAGVGQQFPIEDPVRIEVPAVGINALVKNPDSTDVNVLDNALLSGAVRYPESGVLGDTSRMYIFGHQSYLPIVHNQAFKTFNGLQNLKAGDEIIVYSATAAYHYQVSTVELVTAQTGIIELGGSDRMLTLSTCDSFGTKSDRYVVTAAFVSRNPLTAGNT